MSHFNRFPLSDFVERSDISDKRWNAVVQIIEVLLERDKGDAEDGSVLELRITIDYEGPAAVQRHGYVRLRAEYVHKLAEWLWGHSQHLKKLESEEEPEDG